MNSSFIVLIVACLLAASTIIPAVMAESDVVILDSENFEHLTQASSGATTGDWMVEFYAPWCGHCKHLAPVYEEVATELKGEVNVAKVDASKERSIGSRFEIKGFPTILFLSHGQVYKYKGKRTKDALVEFAKGGYKLKVEDAQPVPQPMGPVAEFFNVFIKSYRAAVRDLAAGKFTSPNVLTLVLPLFLGLLMLILICVPVEAEPRRKKVVRKPASTAAAAAAETKKD
jgi:protein disulfide-isomerase-like protein